LDGDIAHEDIKLTRDVLQSRGANGLVDPVITNADATAWGKRLSQTLSGTPSAWRRSGNRSNAVVHQRSFSLASLSSSGQRVGYSSATQTQSSFINTGSTIVTFLMVFLI
jgi:hypothetical protein